MQSLRKLTQATPKLHFQRSQSLSEMPSIAYKPKPYTGKSLEELRALRDKHMNPGIFHFYHKPMLFTDAYMQYMYNEKGEQFLDLFGGICTVSAGHCHPYVTDKIKQQLDRFQHGSTLYINEPKIMLAEKFATLLPEGLDNFYFVNSGSEANELAVHLAKLHTGNDIVCSLYNAYHGAGGTSQNLTAVRTWKYKTNKTLHTVHVPAPSPYRNHFRKNVSDKELTDLCIQDLENQVNYSTSGDLALFISESAYQGVGGITPTTGDNTYHKRAYDIVRKAGGICLADEVQSGWGRLGNRFWGFEGQGVVPDIVSVAKSFGNGIPVAAIATTKEIASKLKDKLHFNTYGGNPVSSTAALATIEAIENDQLQKNSEVVGTYFKQQMQKLQEKYQVIGDVRGEGFMLAMEFVLDRELKTPAPQYALHFLEQCFENNILVGKGGLYGNVIRLQPPMCVNKDDIDYTIHIFDKVFSSLKVE